jgi:hypothetical protein
MKVDSNRKRNLGSILWGVALGIFIGTASLILAAQTGCGLCTHITFAQALFPYVLIVDPSLSNYAFDALLAGIQWPLYGAMVGAAIMSLKKQKTLLIISLLLVVHVLSVVIANRKVNGWWEPKRLGSVNVLLRTAI